MYSRHSAALLAARIRSLLGNTEVRDTARELGVDVGELREIVEHENRYPSTSVLATLVAYYGVDVSWLLTGEYSLSLHRLTVEADKAPAATIREMLTDLDAPPWVR